MKTRQSVSDPVVNQLTTFDANNLPEHEKFPCAGIRTVAHQIITTWLSHLKAGKVGSQCRRLGSKAAPMLGYGIRAITGQVLKEMFLSQACQLSGKGDYIYTFVGSHLGCFPALGKGCKEFKGSFWIIHMLMRLSAARMKDSMVAGQRKWRMHSRFADHPDLVSGWGKGKGPPEPEWLV